MSASAESYQSSPIAVVIEGLSKFYPRAFRLDSNTIAKPWPFNRIGRTGATTPGDMVADEGLGADEDDEEEIEEVAEDEDADARKGDVWALRDVNLVIEKGSSVALIGNNGAGKTTLLRILTRALPPSSGRVQLYGRVSPFVSLASLFTQPELTGRENVQGFAQFFEIPQEVVDRQIGAVCEFAELDQHFDLKVKAYSSGMVNRLAFSAVVNLDPQILLADTTIAVGDKGFRKRCVGKIREVVDSNQTTLLFASHDLDLVQDLCTEAIWLHEGRVEGTGKVHKVVEEYEHFLGQGQRRHADSDAGAKAGDEPQPVATPEADKSGPPPDVSEHGFVQGVALFSMRGEAITSARVDEDIMLELTVHIPVSRAKVRCVFVLFTETGQKLRVLQQEPFPVYSPGDYTASVLVPAGSLAEGAYDVRAGAQISSGKDKSAIVRNRAFSFDAYDPEGGVASGEEEPGESVEGIDSLDPTSLAWDVAAGLKRHLRA